MSIPFYSNLNMNENKIENAKAGNSEIITILEADFATPKGLWEYDEGLYYVKCYYFNCYTTKANLTNKQVTMFTGPCWIVIDYASSMSYSKRVSVYAGDEVFYCAYNNLGGPSANQFDFKYTKYLAKDNTSAYTPTDDYHPATKAYVDSKFQEEIAIDIFFITQMPDGNDCTEYFDRKRFQKVLNMETKDVLLVRPSGTGSDGMWYYKVMSISSWTNNAGLPVLNFAYIDTYSSEPKIQTLSFCLDAENEIVYKGQNGPN